MLHSIWQWPRKKRSLSLSAPRITRGGTLAMAALVTAISFSSFSDSHAQNTAANAAAAARCNQWFASVEDWRELRNNDAAIHDIRRCIEHGVDPPLEFRLLATQIVAEDSTLPTSKCPPFSTCNSEARRTQQSSTRLNPVIGTITPGGAIEALEPYQHPNAYSAPQFTGHTPAVLPAHLINGGTVYFYETTRADIPARSMIWPDNAGNRYARGGVETVLKGHVTILPTSDGQPHSVQPLVVKQTAIVNFHDYGVLQMPAGYNKLVGANQYICVHHNERVVVPAETKIWPWPENSAPEYAHEGPDAPARYSGPPIREPSPCRVVSDPREVIYP